VTLKRLASVQEQRFHQEPVSLSPTPNQQDLPKAAAASSKENSLDDLLDALQSYTTTTSKKKAVATVSPLKNGKSVAAGKPAPPPRNPVAGKAPPPPPPPRTSSSKEASNEPEAVLNSLRRAANGEVIDSRHQELLTRQKNLTEQFQRLQEMQKKSGNASESQVENEA